MSKSFFRKLSSVALAAGLVAASSVASATTTASVVFDPTLLSLLSAFNVNIGASGSATYAAGTFGSPATDLGLGDTTLTFAPDAGLTFTVTGQGALTFDSLVYDASQSTVLADLHFVNGAVTYDYTDITVFNVGPLSAPLDTLLVGGSVSGAVSLSQSGLTAVANSLGIPAPSSDLPAGTMTFTATAPVPEPSTWSLGLFGLAGVGLARAAARRRHRA